MNFIEKIFDQTFSNHPYLFLFMVLVTGGVLTHSYNVFAQKEEVTQTLKEYSQSVDDKFFVLERKIDTNRSTFMNSFSQQTIRAYTSEIHTLSELDRAGKANQRDRKRLTELKQGLEDEQVLMRGRTHKGHP